MIAWTVHTLMGQDHDVSTSICHFLLSRKQGKLYGNFALSYFDTAFKNDMEMPYAVRFQSYKVVGIWRNPRKWFFWSFKSCTIQKSMSKYLFEKNKWCPKISGEHLSVTGWHLSCLFIFTHTQKWSAEAAGFSAPSNRHWAWPAQPGTLHWNWTAVVFSLKLSQ